MHNEIKIKFEGPDADEALRAAQDWLHEKGLNSLEVYLAQQDIDVETKFTDNLVQVRT